MRHAWCLTGWGSPTRPGDATGAPGCATGERARWCRSHADRRRLANARARRFRRGRSRFVVPRSHVGRTGTRAGWNLCRCGRSDLGGKRSRPTMRSSFRKRHRAYEGQGRSRVLRLHARRRGWTDPVHRHGPMARDECSDDPWPRRGRAPARSARPASAPRGAPVACPACESDAQARSSRCVIACSAQPLPSGSLKKTKLPQGKSRTSLTSTPRRASSSRLASASSTTI